MEILGIIDKIEWKTSKKINQKNNALLKLPSGLRLQALIQVGLAEELEKEIVYINSVLNKRIAEESINISQHLI